MTLLTKRSSAFFSLLILAGLMLASGAASAKSQDAAYDENGGFVVDSDGDCVRTKWMDSEDPCAPPAPPAPPPAPVAAPAPAPAPVVKLEQRTVYFGFDKAELDEAGVEKLNYLVQVINSSRAIADVQIVGYADEMGANSYNQKLSEARVKAVEAFLDQRSRMDTKAADIRALGELADMPECGKLPREKRIECLQPQRRVEVEFKYQLQQ